VSFDGSGGFVVVWSTSDPRGPGQDGSGSGVFAREFGADGNPETDDLLVNLNTALSQRNPSIAYLEPAKLIVAWDSQGQDGSGSGIVARHFEVTNATTTTTLPAEPLCGDPVSDAGAGASAVADITVADALFVLKAAVGGATCAACRCDVDGSGSVTASDAVQVLRRALGMRARLDCPLCT
jgi:hypothetical protein